mgnify:FL=1
MNIHQSTIDLWIANDQDIYRDIMDALKDADNVYDFSTQLRDIVEGKLFDGVDTFQQDVMMSSLAEVKWNEIADDFWAEYVEG